jgi:hypothetical protein
MKVKCQITDQRGMLQACRSVVTGCIQSNHSIFHTRIRLLMWLGGEAMSKSEALLAVQDYQIFRYLRHPKIWLLTLLKNIL